MKSEVWIFLKSWNWRFGFKNWALRIWNWKFGNENLGLKKTWKLWIWIFIFNPFQKKFHHFFFFWVDWDQPGLIELTQLLAEFKCGGRNFAPPLLCFSLFPFFASSSPTSLPPLTLFIFFISPFLLTKNTFLSFLTFPHPSPSTFL